MKCFENPKKAQNIPKQILTKDVFNSSSLWAKVDFKCVIWFDIWCSSEHMLSQMEVVSPLFESVGSARGGRQTDPQHHSTHTLNY